MRAKKKKKKTPSAAPGVPGVPGVGWLVMVRPAKNRSIAWWPVDAAGRDAYVCVTLDDGDGLGGYVTDPTFSDSVPANYVERVQRLWRQEYKKSTCDWVFKARKIEEPRAVRAVKSRATGVKRAKVPGSAKKKKQKVRS